MRTFRGLIFLVAFAVVASLGGDWASAADLGGSTRTRVSEPPPPPSRPSALRDDLWAGFYAGIGIGYAIGGNGFDDSDTSSSSDDSPSQVLGSAFVGYNWRLGRLVYGIEGEIGIGSLPNATMAGLGTVNTDADYQAALRARVGVLVTPSLLLFVTGGGTYAGLTFTDVATANTASQDFFGYQVGAGAEWKMTDKLSARFDYNFNDLGSSDVTLSGATSTFEPTFHTLRLGLSYKF